MNRTDNHFFRKARSIALISDFQKTRVGCVAVYKGTIIGIGCNTEKTHPMQKYYNKYRDCNNDNNNFSHKLHAEINCINQIKHLDINFSKVKLYIYRIRKDQPYGIARPCRSCMNAIKDLGIKNIYYTSNDGVVFEKIKKYSNGGAA